MASKNNSVSKDNARIDREAEGLRSNLKRRKQQQKEREQQKADNADKQANASD